MRGMPIALESEPFFRHLAKATNSVMAYFQHIGVLSNLKPAHERGSLLRVPISTPIGISIAAL